MERSSSTSHNLALNGYVVTEKQELSFAEKKPDFMKLMAKTHFMLRTLEKMIQSKISSSKYFKTYCKTW